MRPIEHVDRCFSFPNTATKVLPLLRRGDQAYALRVGSLCVRIDGVTDRLLGRSGLAPDRDACATSLSAEADASYYGALPFRLGTFGLRLPSLVLSFVAVPLERPKARRISPSGLLF